MACRNYMQMPLVLKNDTEQRKDQTTQGDKFDYLQREKWLRAAVLGADDGLVSVASLMMGVGLLKKDITAKIKPVVQGFLQLPLVLASSKGVHLIMAL